jgi:hypothetical protein
MVVLLFTSTKPISVRLKISRLKKTWGPFNFVLSPIFTLMKPPNSGTSGKSADSIIYDEIECAKDEIKFPKRTMLSPRSSLTCNEADLILKTLAAKVNSLVTKLHKDFNPIAQGTSFYLKKNPAGEMIGNLFWNKNHLPPIFFNETFQFF